ncbi:SCO7613 C-terminal domain-containing membrane protein [Nocardioides sp. AE5]|uniref:SCO7613 C-terminal domain-containing membrane protein n=1 Tax=Nocardioides sp. AE5 TaxID=2962573 RepID=UPI002881E834|nr:hypothetical protein [Nocardioides sp. AE5]MDT0202535.1 hypothetical protein [Nocardioides sp. AE5]
MFRYADTEVCPVCRATMARNAHTCPSCHTTLSGSVAQELFRTLTRADGLVADLLRLSANSTAARTAGPAAAVPATGTVPVGAPAVAPSAGNPAPAPAAPARVPAAPAPSGQGPGTAGLPAFPAPRPAPARTGFAAESGAKILLGLGALCLLVAAIVFIAVAWSQMGVGGRTAVLLGLTAAAAATATFLAHRELRGGAEAFTTVALGFLVVDVFGARSSGWLPQMDGDTFTLVLGCVIGAVALVVALVAARARIGRLISAQLISALAWATGSGALAVMIDGAAGVTAGLVATLVLAAGCHALRLRISAVTLAIVTIYWWLFLVVTGLGRLDGDPTYAAFFGGLTVWPLLVAAALAGALAVVRPLPLPVRVTGLGAAVAVISFVLAGPASDEEPIVVVGVALLFVALGMLTVTFRRDAWAWAISAPVVSAALALTSHATMRLGHAMEAHLDHGTWTSGAGVRLPDDPEPWHYPLALPLTVLGLVAAAWVAVMLLTPHLFRSAQTPRWVVPTAVLTVGSAALLPGAYGAPAALAVIVLLLVATAAALVALRSSDEVAVVAGTGVAGAATLVALLTGSISDVLTAITTGAVVAGSLALAASGRIAVRGIGDVLLAPAAAVFTWTVLHLADVDQSWRAAPILVVIGLWAITRARLTREVPVAATALVATSLSIGMGAGNEQAWTAIDLTVAGVLMAITALVNAHRRWVAWGALALLTLAQWLRLEQVGVDVVEAYTLPLAVVLLVVGVVTMARRPQMGSLRALGTGLVLATMPSLLLALGDPVSLRALLLGIGCSVAVMAGAALRWSAPIIIGGVAGAMLVIRELAHVDVIPQWLVIGLIGLTLIVVGATWERSLAQVKDAADRLRHLR